MERPLGCLCHFDLCCTLPVIATTVAMQQVWIYSSSLFIMITRAGVSGHSWHCCVHYCIISIRQALQGPLPNTPPPPPAFYACTICSRDGSVSLYPAPLSAILVNTHPVSAFTAVHGQSNHIRAGWRTAGTLQHPALLHFKSHHPPPAAAPPPPPPRPPGPHKRNKRRLKRRRGGGGEESLFQDGSVFPLLFLRREEDACREEGEVCSRHLLIAALGLHPLGLVVLLLWMLLFAPSSAASSTL